MTCKLVAFTGFPACPLKSPAPLPGWSMGVQRMTDPRTVTLNLGGHWRGGRGQCPTDARSYGWHIKSCFGYVNIDLHGYAGRPTGMGHLPPTRLGVETYRELERIGAPASFVYEMMLQVAAQAESRQQAEEIVASLPARQVSAASVEWRVRAEYERLRCSQ